MLFLRLRGPEKLHQGRDLTGSGISVETEETNADCIEKVVVLVIDALATFTHS